MKGRRQEYIGNFLFVLNVFVVFLLIFESKLVVPVWLQPFGRMHPLILHFPIVLLLLSMVMEFFRFRTTYQADGFYQYFTSNLLLVGVISSGITVIMGLFLSQEEGYTGSVLLWHKWAGIGVFFMASIVYTCRNFTWYKGGAARGGALLTTLCLILAGHFGAALTHGDNFIWQPVLTLNQPVVPLEEAILFDHVIKPVFEQKCISCHNPEKLKGKLILTDSASILKGGKTGNLFVAGKPEESLLLKRIHLPLADKKHMPPSGKTQLTPDEMELLYLWIKGDAPFHGKVTELPASDSLRLVAATLLRRDENTAEMFDFPAADPQALEQLNTNYRVVSPLAKESPALTVNVYNSAAFTPKTLDELKAVRHQIISLELNKMPVKNEDLKTVSQFENLRRLNLNFTQVTGVGLQALTPLKHLNSLSLSGTKINYQDLQRYLPDFKRLNTLALWDTGLSASEIEQLQAANKNIEIIGGFLDDGSHPIKLNLPRIKNKFLVFEKSLPLELFHPVKDVQIRFTTDGSDPDSLTSTLFTGETTLRESTIIKARAYKKAWLSSDVATLNVYRSGYKPDTVILLSRLNRVHQANGARTFFDHQLGSFNANSPAWANNWAGVINGDMVLVAEFRTPKLISSVALNTLVETETFIFPPESIEIWGGPSQDKLELIARMKPDLPQDYSKPFIRLIDCSFKAQNVSCLKIIAKPVMKLSAWHKRKGKPALLLVDEIFIN
jgi:uncharacterized membrane protein